MPHHSLRLIAPPTSGTSTILTDAALEFLSVLNARFQPERRRLLALRAERQKRLNAGEKPHFLSATQPIRDASWKVSKAPEDLQDRRVEITGPVERKMIINALNSGAKTFMADFEDSTTPTWANLIDGQINLRDAVRRTIAYVSPEGKHYALNANPAVLLVRPRGWHLPEAHVTQDGDSISASLFDFGLFLFHNAAEQVARGTGAYFYLPKLESHLEARLWNEVIDFSEDYLGLKRGTVRCTVLIETILAAFEMEEILYVLRKHIVGLNCGRWDYIFSYIRAFQCDPTRLLPDRAQVTMDKAFLRAYSQLLIHTCHKRGAHAMGGMSAFIPIRHDAQANDAAMAKVRADKQRESTDGHDGTWVAHPGLVGLAEEIFNQNMPHANQLERLRADVTANADTLLEPHTGEITEPGVRGNLRVALEYIAAWLTGLGCVPIHNLMEDAATAEIARSQLWQWAHSGSAELNDGRKITLELVLSWLAEESGALAAESARLGALDIAEATQLLHQLINDPHFATFLTLPAYNAVLAREKLN